MNAVEETMMNEGALDDIDPNSPSMKRLVRYLPPVGRRLSQYDPHLIKINVGQDLVAAYDGFFDR